MFFPTLDKIHPKFYSNLHMISFKRTLPSNQIPSHCEICQLPLTIREFAQSNNFRSLRCDPCQYQLSFLLNARSSKSSNIERFSLVSIAFYSHNTSIYIYNNSFSVVSHANPKHDQATDHNFTLVPIKSSLIDIFNRLQKTLLLL